MSAREAGALARQPQMITYVLSPILTVYRLKVPDRIRVGTTGSARLWWFGVIPAWTHHLEIKTLEPTEIYTHEHGGPVQVWNHRLIFEPLNDQQCRYTDEIEVEDGWRGLLVLLFVGAMFRHRHRRWRQIAEILDGANEALTTIRHHHGLSVESPESLA